MLNNQDTEAQQITNLINDPALRPQIDRLTEEIFYKGLLNKSEPSSEQDSTNPSRLQIKVAICTCMTLSEDGPENFLESLKSNLNKIRSSNLIFQGSTILGIISTVLAFHSLFNPPENKDYYNVAPNPFAYGLLSAIAMRFTFQESSNTANYQEQLKNLLTPRNHFNGVPRAQVIPQADVLEQGLARVNPEAIQTAILERPHIESAQRNTARSSRPY